MSIKVLIYNEHIQDKDDEKVIKVYPNGIHTAIASALNSDDFNVSYAFLENIEETITEEVLSETDVLIWWGHCGHNDVPDSISKLVTDAIKKGMGFIPLHSAHMSKPMVNILGSSCTLNWRDNYDKERIWVSAPYHPIAEGIPESFELSMEEMYGEPFDIPNAEDIVFMGWFSGGNVFRSGVTFRRGYGKVFYFQPGHETYPIFYNEIIQKIIKNAVIWAKPDRRLNKLTCANIEPLY